LHIAFKVQNLSEIAHSFIAKDNRNEILYYDHYTGVSVKKVYLFLIKLLVGIVRFYGHPVVAKFSIAFFAGYN